MRRNGCCVLLVVAVIGLSSSSASGAAEDGECTPREVVGPARPVADPNGPYYHQVRLGTLTDGAVSGDTLLADHASVPDAIAIDDDRLAIYYVNGSKGTVFRGVWNGRRLRHREPIIIDGVRGGAGAVDPDVIRLPNGDIRLAYFNGFGPPVPGADEHVMCIADSGDGIHFESRAVIFRGSDLTDPSLTLRDNTWYLAVSHGTEAVIASSDDGEQFEELTTVTDGGVPEITTSDDGSLLLYVCGRDGVVELTSEDGTTWTKGGTVLQPGTCDPSVVVGSDDFVYKSFAPNAARPPSPPG